MSLPAEKSGLSVRTALPVAIPTVVKPVKFTQDCSTNSRLQPGMDCEGRLLYLSVAATYYCTGRRTSQLGMAASLHELDQAVL